jgi:hypothetical protein
VIPDARVGVTQRLGIRDFKIAALKLGVKSHVFVIENIRLAGSYEDDADSDHIGGWFSSPCVYIRGSNTPKDISPHPLALARVLRHEAHDLHRLRVSEEQEKVVVRLAHGFEDPGRVVDAHVDEFQLGIEVDACGDVCGVAWDREVEGWEEHGHVDVEWVF